MFIHKDQPEYQDLPNKTIDGKRWYKVLNGQYYASITTILGHEEKEWLTKWKKSLGEDKASKEQKRCAERGEAVHLMAEMYLKNESNVTKNQKTEYVYIFNKMSYALDRINNIRAQEIPLFSNDLKIAGRCDCIGEFDGKLSIIDFKTSTKSKTSDMILDYKLQITGYSLMFFEMFGIFIDQGVIMIATEKGLLPQTFKIQTEEFIQPLIERINTFYNEVKYIPK